MMAQCDHDFQVDPKDGQVKCIKCGDFDDEMQSLAPEPASKEEPIEFDKSQVSFE